MSNEIKYPFAIEKSTNKIVEPAMVPNGLKCNCKCFYCNEDLMSISKAAKQKDHFRHLNGSKCESNLESFFHWAAKEVLKDEKRIKLPDIHLKIGDFDELKVIIDKYNLEFFPKYSDIVIIQKKRLLEFKECSLEKQFNSDFGKIVVDFVIENNGGLLLVEPYYMNPINDEKYKKIKNLNFTTISIDIRPFAEKNKYLFSLEEFKKFLIDDVIYKKWEHINSLKFNKIKSNYISKLNAKIESNSKINIMTESKTKLRATESKIQQLKKELMNLEIVESNLKLDIKSIERDLIDVVYQPDFNDRQAFDYL